MAQRYHRGDHPYIEIKNYDENGDLADCDAGYPKIIVNDSVGAEKVVSTQMSNVSTGIYKYDGYQLAATDLLGFWTYDAECITSGKERHYHGGFEVI